ncbi:hypothetical protein MTO96_006039 [Rhipicephalus appendiculatus]
MAEASNAAALGDDNCVLPPPRILRLATDPPRRTSIPRVTLCTGALENGNRSRRASASPTFKPSEGTGGPSAPTASSDTSPRVVVVPALCTSVVDPAGQGPATPVFPVKRSRRNNDIRFPQSGTAICHGDSDAKLSNFGRDSETARYPNCPGNRDACPGRLRLPRSSRPRNIGVRRADRFSYSAGRFWARACCAQRRASWSATQFLPTSSSTVLGGCGRYRQRLPSGALSHLCWHWKFSEPTLARCFVNLHDFARASGRDSRIARAVGVGEPQVDSVTAQVFAGEDALIILLFAFLLLTDSKLSSDESSPVTEYRSVSWLLLEQVVRFLDELAKVDLWPLGVVVGSPSIATRW